MKPSSCGRTRVGETLVALCIGIAVDLLVTTGAQAEGRMTVAELADLSSVSGAAGGLVAAMVHFSALAVTPPTEGRKRNFGAASLEGVFSVIVGGLCAHWLAVPFAAIAPWVPLTSAPVMGFGIGVFAWQTAPGIMGGAKLALKPQNVARAILRVLTRWAGPEDTPK